MFYSKIVISMAVVAFVSAQHGHEASSHNSHDSHEYQGRPVYHQALAAPVDYNHAPSPFYKAAPIVVQDIHHEAEEHYAPAHYQFKYAVNDEKTHDIKEQEESREGDVVKGYYSLVQPDGVTRIVHYTADKHNGFQAQVEYTGHASHPEVQQKIVAAPVVHKAVLTPVQKVVAAPADKTARVYKVPAYPHF